MHRKFLLSIFDEGTGGTGAGTPPAAPPATPPAAPQNNGAQNGNYTYAQAEEIANARADRAARAAISEWYKQQGLSQDEATEAIKRYKEAKQAGQPDVDTLTKERDAALAKVAEMEQSATLTKLGVKPEFSKFVVTEVREMMKADKDGKLTFDKAAEKYLKDHKQYTGAAKQYKVTTSPDSTSGTTGKPNGYDKSSLNAMIRAAARR